MALKLTRKPDQQLLLSLAPGTTAEQLFEQLQDGILIQVCDIDGQAVKLGVTAPSSLIIIRPEKHSAESWEHRPRGKRSIWNKLQQVLRSPVSTR